jgi:hypothetical protein
MTRQKPYMFRCYLYQMDWTLFYDHAMCDHESITSTNLHDPWLHKVHSYEF